MAADAFWDTSALVPLCISQAATPRAVAHRKNYGSAVWWATPVEIAAAFARLVRMKDINTAGLKKAQEAAEKLALEWIVIVPSESIRKRAVEATAKYDLRAADALQLAAALEWCDDQPLGKTFLTADQRLRDAALRAGFDAKTV